MAPDEIADGKPSSKPWRKGVQLALSPILSSALDAFHQKGYHGTSVREIASRTGMTVPALYYHHANKEAMLYSLLDKSVNQAIARSVDALADAGSDPAQKFFNLVECQIICLARNVKIAAMDAEIRSLSKTNRRAYADRRHVIEDMLVDAIREAAQARLFEVTDPAITARALLGMIQAIALWYKPTGSLSVQDLVDRYLDIAAHAVGCKPDVMERLRRQPLNGGSNRNSHEQVAVAQG
jgi:AcrR family transcriptional regulator